MTEVSDNNRSAGDSALRGESAFNIVVSYEDATTRDRALALTHYLEEHLSEDAPVHTAWWRFDLLTSPPFREAADRDMARADLIVLAMRTPELLPEHIWRWLEAWACRWQPVGGAMVTLIADGGTESLEASAAKKALQELCGKARLSFFEHHFGSPRGATGAPASILEPRAMDQRTREIPRWMAEMLEQSTHLHGWGLNE